MVDRTPRTARVPERTAGTGSPDGTGGVVVGVTDLSEAIESCRAVFGLGVPEQHHDSTPGAESAVFDAEPVVLATPDGDPGWLTRRIRMYGPCPAACVFTHTGSTPDEPTPVAGGSTWNGTGSLARPRSRVVGTVRADRVTRRSALLVHRPKPASRARESSAETAQFVDGGLVDPSRRSGERQCPATVHGGRPVVPVVLPSSKSPKYRFVMWNHVDGSKSRH